MCTYIYNIHILWYADARSDGKLWTHKKTTVVVVVAAAAAAAEVAQHKPH